ncbi:adenylate/guanylate cyclase domain-containing protein [Candidatus Uabimicrobium sp. HlEnr_7]|uniref:adenylate/guanylate cyclase domain-containing protein n=1 Tax=Candidatus Uabimicrobium helgolandensis TaxID=3095367 RepID=UPI003556CD1F
MRFSIRTSILVVLLLLIVLCSSMLITVFYFNSKISVQFILKDLMRNISLHMTDKCIHYLHTAETASRLSKNLTSNQVVQTQNQEILLQYFRQLLLVNKQFAMVTFGKTDGDFFMVKRMPDDTFSTKTIRRTPKIIYSTWVHQNPKWEKEYPNTEESPQIAYDPRNRPWFQESAKSRQISWTDVYLFYSDQTPGITCSTPVYDRNEKLIGVVGIDISISGFSFFLGNLRIGKNGKAFILNHKDEIIALPAKNEVDLQKISQRHSEKGTVTYKLSHIKDAPSSTLKEFYASLELKVKNNQKLKSRFKEYLDNTSDKLKNNYKSLFLKANEMFSEEIVNVSFHHDNQNYIAMYAPFAKEMGWNWKIVILSPEDDFMSVVHWTNVISFVIAGLCIIIALVVSLFFSKRLSFSLKILEGEMEKVKNLQLTKSNITRSRITEVDSMALAFEKMKSGLRSFKKFVPSDVVNNALINTTDATLGGEKKNITTFFSDVAGFTTIAEAISTEKLLQHLSEYLDIASNTIHGYQGTVDKFIGDAVMAFWGAPYDVKDHAILACRAALLTQRQTEKLTKKWHFSWKVRIGINTGEAIVGNMGCNDRMDYTAVGDSVNLASRLEAINKIYGTDIVIGENTYNLVKDIFETRLLDFVIVKGKTEEVAIYELLAEKDELSVAKKRMADNYTIAMRHYQQNNWNKALEIFEGINKQFPQDQATQFAIEKCNKLRED